jgi:quercetin dioxygenase-like cupin family protein
LHKHDAINAGVLLSGELTVVTETNEVLHMKPGEALIELVGKWHYGKNEGSIPAEIIVFYASTLNAPLTVNKQQ